MHITIEHINVRNLGPIQEINEDLRDFNLFYGPNEIGKTYVVEFIIQSIFRTKDWSIRPFKGQGNIKVSGIEDNITDFSPTSSKKIEDWFEEGSIGLPPEFSKLLVVKGAEMELRDKKEADKIILRRYLSSKEILDEVQSNIEYTTYEKANIENRTIIIDKRGPAKIREELKKEIKNIGDLNSDIEDKVMGGELKELTKKKEKLEKSKSKIERAKRHKAYQIHKEIENLKEKKKNIHEEKLDEASGMMKEYDIKNRELKTKKSNYNKLKEKAKHYEWLSGAIETHNNLISKTASKKPIDIYLGIFFVLIGLSALFTLFEFSILALGLILASIIPVVIYARKFNNYLSQKVEVKELENIEKEYKNRFGKEMSGLVGLKEQKKKKEEAYHEKRKEEKDIRELVKLVEDIKTKIIHYFKENFSAEVDENDWDDELIRLKKIRKKIRKKLDDKNTDLLKLNVEEDDYLKVEQQIEYDKNEWQETCEELEKTEKEIKKLEEEHGEIKEETVDLTKANYNDDWNIIISKLKEKRRKDIKRYKQITSKIEGSIAVMEVINELRETEDEKIKENLGSDVIQKPLKDITDRYNKYKLEDETLYLSDEFFDFPLNELSTGAQHQALIALRMGFASRILKDKNMFLIFDDAFQYSDYERRENLVEKISNLVRNGWQVIYFTMDDHIKDLLENKGKEFGKNYKYFELEDYVKIS